MANFLLSNAFKGATNLSNLVDKVSQIKDHLEKQMDSAVGEEPADEADSSPVPFTPSPLPSAAAIFTVEEEEKIQSPVAASIAVDDEDVQAEQVDEEQATTDDNNGAQEESDIIIGQLKRERAEAQEALKRREQQLEKTSRKLAEQEDQLQQLRDQVNNLATDKRVKLAEQKAEGLLKEGLVLAEKEGKAQAQLRKIRAEREELAKRERALQDQVKRETEARLLCEQELQTLRETRKRDELDRAHLSESSSETKKRVDELRHQLSQCERREVESKLEFDRVMLELAEQKKLVFSVSQQLSATKREAEHAKFQLKEQLDSRNLHGNRADLMERSLAEAKQATEEQWKEARQVELGLRSQLVRAQEQLGLYERKAEEAAQRALELTAPLLRQIDVLNEQRAKTEQSTSALLTRAVTSEAAETEAIAAKRKAEMQRSELALKVSELETQVASLQVDCSRAMSDYKLAVRRAEEAERERDLQQKQFDVLRQTSDAKVADYRTTEMQLRQTLALENEKLERAKRAGEEKVRELEERIAHLQQQQQQQLLPSTFASPVAGMAAAAAAPLLQSDAASSVYSSHHHMNHQHNTQEEILGSVLFGDDFSANSVAVDFTDSSSKFLLQASELQAGLRRRDLKISALAEQLDMAQKQREDLVQELHRARDKLAHQERNANLARELATTRHQNALLCELLGEKEEQIDGLTADVQELKQKFRQQFESM